MWFILILLLVAAAFGVLGAVLKAAFILIAAVILTLTALVVTGMWLLRRQMRKLERAATTQVSVGRAQRNLPPVDDRY
jgi:cytochrome oxidase assembly protein ShyY1